MKKLISMTDFVFEQRKDQTKDNVRRFWACEKYTKLLKQPLTLGMFVPCDENGNMLNYITECEFGVGFDESVNKEHQEAKEHVLFEDITLTDAKFIIWSNKTIEDLVQYNLTLTDTAIKQL